ncbi:hypothetical protein DER45DRAFT_617320 [Fusarium avenaceum]|nr:hypothetical protein DER45DRAFT_617320 [Fusarium avenaceum]
MLTNLPPEVLEHICEKLNGLDLKRLSLTSKWLHKAAFRQLWRSITIEPGPGNERHVINHLGPPQPFLQSTRELHFDAGIERGARRCIHVTDWLGSLRNWMDNEPQEEDTWQRNSNSFGLGYGKLVRVKYECLAQRAMAVLKRFDNNQLEHFSWNYTTCIPSEVLEYLSLNHPSIQGLSFTTDPFCSKFNRWSRTSDLDLSAFCNLRRLSWEAPMGCHFDNIAKLIMANSVHMEDLEIDLQSWSREWEHRESRAVHHQDNPEEWDRTLASTMLARQIFGLQSRPSDSSERPSFPRLRHLKLTRLPLRDEITKEVVNPASISFDTLRSLSLRMCPYWMPFLSQAFESGIPPKLRKLEILDFYLHTPEETAVRKTAAVAKLLDSFKGLEELFISHCGPTSALEFLEHVAGHKATLKWFVHHQRTRDQDEETLMSRMGDDIVDFGISQVERDRIRVDPLQNPLSKLSLEFLGLTCAPEFLRDILLPFVSKNSLKALHIRQTGVNMGSSPSWVFNQALEARIREAERHDTTKVDVILGDQEEGDRTNGPEYIATALEERKEWKTPPLHQSFRDFADWVFGQEGIKSLDYIITGDLSHGNRYCKNNFLICRSVGGGRRYRVISQGIGGPEWWDVESRFGGALEACPVENIVLEY